MLIGFIVLIVFLLVIVGLMSSSSLSNDSSGTKYITEAKKIQVMLSNMENESQFYFARDETFNGIGIKYYENIGFHPELIVPQDPSGSMSKNDWENWPDETYFPSPYSGPYIELKGSAAKDLRVVISPLNNGNNMGIYILKRKGSTVDPVFLKTLEKVLSSDSNYIGG